MEFDWKYLSVPLPDDIQMLKDNGNWDLEQKTIDLRMERPIPEAMKQRLKIEKAIIEVLRNEYPYSKEEAIELMASELDPFDPSELDFYQNEGTADWHFVDGKVHFQKRFFRTLVRTKPEIHDKLKVKSEDDPVDQEEARIYMENIHEMKKNGGSAYHIKARCYLKVEDEAFRPGEKIRVHLPVVAAAQQNSNIKILNVSPEPTSIEPENSTIRSIYFEHAPEKNEEYSVEFEFDNKVKYYDLDPELVAVTPQPEDMQHDLREQLPHIVFTPFIKALAAELTEGITNPLLKARAFYDYVTTRVKYTFMRAYFTLENIPEYAAKNLKGDCGVQALLFITLCRAAGIPAKWQSGLCAGPLTIGMHDWAQFYIAPYGWLYADCSYGGSAYRTGNEEKWNHYFGNLDPFRIVFNSEFQEDFVPAKDHIRQDPYDHQLGEAEYEDHGLMKHEFDADHELISCEKIEWN